MRGQTRIGSAIETATNIVVGFSVNYVANITILPAIGLPITHSQAFGVGLIYTVISVVRSYGLRRLFNRIRRLHHA